MSVESGRVDSHSVAATDAGSACDDQLLAGLNESLHTMSQPLTALLCMLGYGTGLERTDELKEVMTGGLEQCDRLMESVRSMQMRVVETQILRATQRDGAARTRF